MKPVWKIFDFDGTLVDSNNIWVEVDLQFLARRGKKPTAEYTEFVAHAIYPTAARFTREYYALDESEEEIMDAWTALAREAYRFHAPVKEGVTAYLAQCAAKGEKLALFTAGFPELCRLALERHGLERYFDPIVFAQDFGLEKRDPRAFEALLGKLGARAEECVMFDDSPRNCRSARTAGLKVVGVHDSYFAADEARVRASCDRYIYSFWELAEK